MEEKRPVGRPRKETETQIPNQVSVDLTTLKLASDTLKKEVERLGNLKVNMEAEIHALEMKRENTIKFEKVDINKQVHEEEVRLNKVRDELSSRERDIENKEISLKDRLKALEKREQDLVDLEKIRKSLSEERSNFFKYKFGIEQELEKAKIVIAEAKAKDDDYKLKEDALKAREIKMQKLEKYWNDEIGKLEHEKKEFQIEKENILGLKTQEVVNG